MIVISQIDIERPAADVWDFIVNPENIGLWRSGFGNFDSISGGYAVEGALIKAIYKRGGRTMELMEEFKTVRPGKEISGRFSHKDINGTFLYIFTSVKNDTRLTLELDFEYRSGFRRFFGFFFRRGLTSRLDRDFAVLKKLLEKDKQKPASRRRSGSTQMV